MLTLDIETRSRCNLRKCGTYAYAADPTTALLCVSAQEDDAEPVVWAGPTLKEQVGCEDLGGITEAEMRKIIDRHTVIVAHNAAFEREVMAHTGPFRIPDSRWRCSMAICGYYGLPQDLRRAGAALGLDQQKDDKGRLYINRLSVPRRDGTFSGTPEDARNLMEYCRQDVRTEHALYALLGPLPLDEHVVWQMDQDINRRGVYVDGGMMERWIAALEDEDTRLHEEYRALTHGVSSSPRKRDDFLQYAAALGLDLPDARKATITDALRKGGLPPFLTEVLQYRATLSKTSVAKYNALRAWRQHDGRVRGLFRYHGAITGRWSGNGPQPQNLPRGRYGSVDVTEAFNDTLREQGVAGLSLLVDDVFEAASSCIRSMFCAERGHTYVAADFSAIEGRGLAWLAGDDAALQVYRDGKDPYIYTASMIFGTPYDAVTKSQRQNGKVVELACQYRGWSGALKAWAALYNVGITEEQSVQWPAAWRDTRPVICRFWYALEDAAMKALRTGQAVTFRGIGYRLNRRWLECRLPSGRSLWYYHPKLMWDEERKKWALTYMGLDSYTNQWTRIWTHGGKLCENVTQAICADFFRYSMQRVEAAGYPIVLHVHDETVSEVRTGNEPLDTYEQLMSEAPPWAKGFPLAASGWTGKRYRKG